MWRCPYLQRPCPLPVFSYFAVLGMFLGVNLWAVVCSLQPITVRKVWGAGRPVARAIWAGEEVPTDKSYLLCLKTQYVNIFLCHLICVGAQAAWSGLTGGFCYLLLCQNKQRLPPKVSWCGPLHQNTTHTRHDWLHCDSVCESWPATTHQQLPSPHFNLLGLVWMRTRSAVNTSVNY